MPIPAQASEGGHGHEQGPLSWSGPTLLPSHLGDNPDHVSRHNLSQNLLGNRQKAMEKAVLPLFRDRQTLFELGSQRCHQRLFALSCRSHRSVARSPSPNPLKFAVIVDAKRPIPTAEIGQQYRAQLDVAGANQCAG